jgi:hypothetical protein
VLTLHRVTTRTSGNRMLRLAVQATRTMIRSTGIRRWRLLAAAVTVVTAACGSRVPGTAAPAAPGPAATRPAAATGVVVGIVQAGPACPVEGAGHACRPRRLGNVEVRARPARTGVASSARTSADGRFAVRLRPGGYVLTVLTTAIFPRCPQVRVWVRPEVAVRASITCDTGIRLPARAASNPG